MPRIHDSHRLPVATSRRTQCCARSHRGVTAPVQETCLSNPPWSHRALAPSPRSGSVQSGRRGLFSPGSHSTPHAGPHGALPPDWKGHRRMTPSNAGYGAGRQRHFTRSGALRPLRSARLARCRRFWPSPCPTHYGGRWATTPSADFCPVTPNVAVRRAARVTVGSGGVSNPFGLALSPAPLATTAPLGFDGDSSPFGLGLSSTPIAAQTACETDLPG